MYEAFQYVKDHGIGSEKDYPYESKDIPILLPIRFPCRSDTTKDVIAVSSATLID